MYVSRLVRASSPPPPLSLSLHTGREELVRSVKGLASTHGVFRAIVPLYFDPTSALSLCQLFNFPVPESVVLCKQLYVISNSEDISVVGNRLHLHPKIFYSPAAANTRTRGSRKQKEEQHLYMLVWYLVLI